MPVRVGYQARLKQFTKVTGTVRYGRLAGLRFKDALELGSGMYPLAIVPIDASTDTTDDGFMGSILELRPRAPVLVQYCRG